MPQIFHPSTNTISRVSIFGTLFIVGGVLYLLAEINRSPYVTQADVAREQPVPFSHAHHVGGIGIDCRYCHTSVEDSYFAGIPPTKTCINCHSQLWADSPTLGPVLESFRTDRSIEWMRVHKLADFAYFDHSIHIHKGVACVTCHGRVDQMPLMWQNASLLMEWCLDCHRNPAPSLTPRNHVFDMQWEPTGDREALGRALMAEYDVRTRTDCSTCHR
jgi:hypothetical protein